MFERSRLRPVAACPLLLLPALLAPAGALALTADAGGPPPDNAIVSAALPAALDRRAEAMARVAAGQLAADPDPDLAFVHYRRALDLDPANASLAQEIARIHLQRDEVPEALSVLKDTFKHNPRAASLALRIAGIYVISLRKFEPAERFARQALQASPDLIEPYQMLYSICRADGRPGDASKILAQAARRTNEDPVFWAGLADLNVRQLLMEGSLRDTGKSSVALAHYRRAAELGRQDSAVLLRAFNFFFAGGHLEDAVSSGRRLLVLQPSDTLTREKLALALASLQRPEEAVDELEAVVADNPASLLAYRAHGEILLERGDAAGALEKFEKALLLHDDDPRLYLEIADLCIKTDRPERAAWWLSRAREKFTNLPELPFYEGQLLGHLKRWREARNAMDVAADLAARNQPSFLTAEFYFQHGVAAERSGDHDAAARHFLACLELDAGHAQALNYLGYMWAERGENLAAAEELIRRAVDLEPHSAAYLDSLGWVLYQQGRYHEALAPLQQASQLSADAPDPVVEEHLGDVLEKLGRRNDAVKAWERAAALEGASGELPAKLQAARGSAASAAAEVKTTQP
ncbi:MAG: tetratricopeptide repeat protein [Chthoniobacterales bacterium]